MTLCISWNPSKIVTNGNCHLLYSKWSTHAHTHKCVWRETARTFSHNKRGPINKGGYTSVIKCQNDYCVSERLAYSSWTRRVELSSQTTTSMNKRIHSYYKLTSRHVKPSPHIQCFWAFVYRFDSTLHAHLWVSTDFCYLFQRYGWCFHI